MLKKIVFIFFMSTIQFCLHAQALGHKTGIDSYILQYRANLREEPSINSNIIAILGSHDKVEILENLEIEEQINGVGNVWLKIKFENIIGYTFGGNVAVESLITDIDDNGIIDYFYFRYSRHMTIDPSTDIFIYINNKRINTNFLKSGRYSTYDWCRFKIRDDYIEIQLSKEEGNYAFYTTWKVYGDGSIEFLDSSY